MRRAAVIASVGLAAAGVGAVFWASGAAEERPAETPAPIARGAVVYAEACAACHGANLEGAPDWRTPGPDGLLPAPPHDASGHTWHHGDAVLFRITKEGPAAVVGGGYRSAMPGFADVLSDEDIWAVLAFIRSTWPERQRAYQAEMSARETTP
jgi:mono/diheme cytochrome c family protein